MQGGMQFGVHTMARMEQTWAWWLRRAVEEGALQGVF